MATFRVTNTNNGGFGSLRRAISQANTTDGTDTIVFDDSLSGQTIDINRELLIEESVFIDGDIDNDGNADITVSAADFNARPTTTNATRTRIFNIDDGDDAVDSEVILEGLTITGGEDNDDGGGIYSLENLTINSSTITGNSTRGNGREGGGIYIKEASLIINDSTISDNFTRGDDSEGGGIYAEESVVEINGSMLTGNFTEGYGSDGGSAHFENSVVVINNSTISENQTLADGFANADGGGLNFDESTGSINNSSISNNSTTGEDSDGGAIALFQSAVSINSSVLTGNSTDGEDGDGGGVFLETSSVTIVDSTVSDNFTGDIDSEGGGISDAQGDSSNITLRNSTVSGNFTTGDDSEGGGIYADELEVFNSTIDGNFTSGTGSEGGGIFIASNVASLINSTVTGNFTIGTDAEGGGIYLDQDTLRVRSSIVAGNNARAADGNEVNATDSSNVSITNSLLGTTSSTNDEAFEGFTVPTATNIIATSNGTNPTALSDIVAPLANNGGSTQTRALADGSPALDAGSNTAGIGADQRGLNRTAGGGTDIGAFEEQRVQSTINTPDNVTVPENQPVAIDVDASDNNGLSFVISGGADAALFDIDSATGLVTFATAPNFETPLDADTDNVYNLQVTVTNADGLTDVQDLSITVDDINDAPIALDDAGITAAGNPVTVNLTINDFDEDRDVLSIDSVGTAANGRVQIDSDSSITYIPNGGFVGIDSFGYTVTDGSATDAATVSISVGAGGTAQTPVVQGQPATIFVDGSNRVVGNAFEVGQLYAGAINSSTDGSSNPDDVIAGTFGDDNLYGGTEGSDIIAGFSGDDIIGYGAGDAVVLAGSGDDLVYAADPSTFSNSNNVINLGSGTDNFFAFIGNNTVTGSDDNLISVGNGNDTITTQSGDDFIYSLGGGGGNDVLSLGEGDNVVFVERGNYSITTGAGDDVIGLGSGTDTVRAGNGDNIIYMVNENAVGDGNKDIITGAGDDFVSTGSGNDRIDARSGLNTLFGGAGADTFVLRSGAYNFLGDFELNADRIDLEGGLSSSNLGVFQGSGSTAGDVFIFAGSEAIGQVANTTVDAFNAQATFV